MTPNPVGLTRAEEEAERSTSDAPRVAAPPGKPRCRATVPPDGVDCPAEATRTVIWPDGDRTATCADCAARLAQQASSFRSAVRVEAIGGPK